MTLHSHIGDQVIFDMYLKLILKTVSTKLEPQLDKVLLGKHQYHSFICRAVCPRILQILKSCFVFLNDTHSV
jgi:hypothetical protein